MGCTFLVPGSSHPEDLIASVNRGVYVRRIEAAGNDPETGIAVFRVSDADRIVAGRIELPVDAFLMQVSVLRALATLDGIAELNTIGQNSA